jgi:hypothetical protein
MHKILQIFLINLIYIRVFFLMNLHKRIDYNVQNYNLMLIKKLMFFNSSCNQYLTSVFLFFQLNFCYLR